MFFETIPYIYELDPTKKSPDVFLQEVQNGANCQLYVAGFLKAFGYYMPYYYRSSEIYEDPEKIFAEVDCKQDLPEAGDIIGFWPLKKTNNPKKIHVGVICRNTEGFSLLHASKEKGQVCYEPLLDVLGRYDSIACIKRPLFKIQEANSTVLKNLGFYISQKL